MTFSQSVPVGYLFHLTVFDRAPVNDAQDGCRHRADDVSQQRVERNPVSTHRITAPQDNPTRNPQDCLTLIIT
jgi:hypothetical protein